MNQNKSKAPRIPHQGLRTGFTVVVSVLLAIVISTLISHQRISKPLQNRMGSLKESQKRLADSVNNCLEQLQKHSASIDSIKNDIYSVSHDSVNSTALLMRIQKQFETRDEWINTRLSVIEKRHEHICETVDHLRKEFKNYEQSIDRKYSELLKNDRQLKNALDAIDRKLEELERRSDF
ncbi:MAG: hypothetical protein U5R06_16285 [candidate division KSB1 bacterium]|nr:hypothetical protein [candidate division KSB1 bacterium]